VIGADRLVGLEDRFASEAATVRYRTISAPIGQC